MDPTSPYIALTTGADISSYAIAQKNEYDIVAANGSYATASLPVGSLQVGNNFSWSDLTIQVQGSLLAVPNASYTVPNYTKYPQVITSTTFAPTTTYEFVATNGEYKSYDELMKEIPNHEFMADDDGGCIFCYSYNEHRYDRLSHLQHLIQECPGVEDLLAS